MKIVVLLFLSLCSSILSAQTAKDLLTRHQGTWFMYSERTEEQMEDGTTDISELFNEYNTPIRFLSNGAYSGYTFPEFRYEKDAKWKVEDEKNLTLSNTYYEDEEAITNWIIEELTDTKLVLKSPTKQKKGLSKDVYYTFYYPTKTLAKDDAEKLNSSLFPYKPLKYVAADLSVSSPSANSAVVAQMALLEMYYFNPVSAIYIGQKTDFPFRLIDIVGNPALGNVSQVDIKATSPKGKANDLSRIVLNEEGKISSVVFEDGENVNIEYSSDIPAKIKSGENIFNCYAKDNYFFMARSDNAEFLYLETDNNLRLITTRYWLLDIMGFYIQRSTHLNTRSDILSISELDSSYDDSPQESDFSYTNGRKLPLSISKDVHNSGIGNKKYDIARNGNTINIVCNEIAYSDDSGTMEEHFHEEAFFEITLNEKGNMTRIKRFETDDSTKKRTLDVTWIFNYVNRK